MVLGSFAKTKEPRLLGRAPANYPAGLAFLNSLLGLSLSIYPGKHRAKAWRNLNGPLMRIFLLRIAHRMFRSLAKNPSQVSLSAVR